MKILYVRFNKICLFYTKKHQLQMSNEKMIICVISPISLDDKFDKFFELNFAIRTLYFFNIK